MSGGSVASALDEYLRKAADQPFGNTDFVSGETLAPFSRSLLEAAKNLLTKADRALAEGDLERAARFIDRACALNYDEHEKTAPAAWSVGMMLFTAVTDALEESHEDDSRWLDAAVEALSSVDGWGGSEMRHTLRAALQDYFIEPSERQTIEAVVAQRMDQTPEGAELRDVRLPPEELAAAVTSVLRILHAYRAALATGA